MEVHGKSTRENELRRFSSIAVWERELSERVKIVNCYDGEIELCADYRLKDIVRPNQVWQSFADIERVTPQNAAYIACACNLVKEL